MVQYPKSSLSPEQYRLQEEFEREFYKKDPIDPDEDAIDKEQGELLELEIKRIKEEAREMEERQNQNIRGRKKRGGGGR